MADKALGLIETLGLIGAIEACDAAAKAASVVVTSAEVTDAAYLTLKIEGDLGAVQAAVEAGAKAAEKVGELIAVHIIPNPDNNLGAILPKRRYISKYHPDDTRPPLGFDGSEPDMPMRPIRPNRRVQPTYPNYSSRPSGPPPPSPLKDDETLEQRLADKDLDDLTVNELRQLARGLDRFPLKGREISMANKEQLIKAIKEVLDMD